MDDKLEAAVAAVLENKYWYAKQPDGTFRMEIYADYRDEMDDKTAAEICESADPYLALLEKLEEWYFEAERYYRDELEKEVRQALTAPDGPYPDGLGDAEEERLNDVITELAYWVYPEEHYLKQEFCVNIMLDTGDIIAIAEDIAAHSRLGDGEDVPAIAFEVARACSVTFQQIGQEGD